MLHDTPLRNQHELYVQQMAARSGMRGVQADRPGAAVGHKIAADPMQYIPYGFADADGNAVLGCELVGSFGEVEIEYAAIRRSAGVFDSPHRGTLLMTGNTNERRDFLNRMLTQELKDLQPGVAKAAFWLNRKGRIGADLLLLELGDRMLIDVDIHQAASTVKSLSEFIVMEDVQIEDVSAKFHHIAVHGKLAAKVLQNVVADASALQRGDGEMLEAGRCVTVEMGGVPTVIARRDQTGEPGFELIMPLDLAGTIWNELLSMQSPEANEQVVQAQAIGWHAYNIARIEAGTRLFNIDFGVTNLPHESGLLRERVSFTKGCYLGQEVVARMENLGKPKQMLVGLRLMKDLLPTAGEQVFSMDADGSMRDEIGVVTSSTLSPMLGASPVAFAMIKTAHAAVGQLVIVNAEGDQSQATVGGMKFWPIAADSEAL